MSFSLNYDVRTSNNLLKTKYYYSDNISKIMNFVKHNQDSFLGKPLVVDLDDEDEDEGILFDDGL